MSFRTALTGLNAASADLGVISNNIANNNTTGFKQSRAEFGDIYSLSDLGTSTRRSVGTGVKLNSVTQLFKQGNLETTSNPLDLAIDGEGFFSLKETDGSMIYTRAGSFGLDKDGYIVNSRTQRLQGYLTNPTTGKIDIGNTGDLRTQTGNIDPNQTTTGAFGINLNAGDIAPATAFDFRDSTTYNFASAMTTFDSLGNKHSLTAYFVKTIAPPVTTAVPPGLSPPAPANITTSAWNIYFSMDGLGLNGNALPAAGTGLPSGMILFDAFGAVTGTAQGTVPAVPPNGVAPAGVVDTATDRTITVQTSAGPPAVYNKTVLTLVANGAKSVNLANIVPTNGPDQPPATPPTGNGTWNGALNPINSSGIPPGVTLKFDDTTQYGSPSSTNAATQDGYATGRIVGVDVGEDGTMNGRYSNGQAKVLGQVTLANFRSTPGLSPIGDTSWVETAASGQPVKGPPGTASLGLVRAGALELSNVELSEQLVKMISAQRNFQANAQVISTADQMTQTLLNMR
ncbi:MAG: flagellar hook protein FlgE [Candidatus Contendobacter sp.]|nr:flagellar hook protein FlgE [Candidatus Contendobacter sp.]